MIECTFDGEVFQPRTPFMRARARERFGPGEIVIMEAVEERSAKSHRHFFASLKDLWSTLPEAFAAEQWAQSPEHLRRYALIRTGYCDTQTLSCSSAAEARRMAAFMRPIDEFSIVVARDSTVVRFVAKSQSMKAMGKNDFQASKDAVLNFVTQLVEEGARALSAA